MCTGIKIPNGPDISKKSTCCKVLSILRSTLQVPGTMVHMYTGKRPFFSTCLDFLPGTDTGTVPVKCFVLCIFNTILVDPRLGKPSPLLGYDVRY